MTWQAGVKNELLYQVNGVVSCSIYRLLRSSCLALPSNESSDLIVTIDSWRRKGSSGDVLHRRLKGCN